VGLIGKFKICLASFAIHFHYFSLVLLFYLTAIPMPAAERAACFYGVHRVTEIEGQDRLVNWRSQGIGRVIVSIGAGPKFLLDDYNTALTLGRYFLKGCASRY